MDLTQEKELIKKAKKEPAIFGQLYDEYYQPIFGYILKRVNDLEIAQDITSETFLKALKNLWRFRWQNKPFSAWLYRIANHEIANYFRKNKPKIISFEQVPELWLIENPSETLNYQEFLNWQEKIQQLPIKYQEVIILRFYEDKSIKEVAEILKKKEGTVKSLLHRGLERLKATFCQ
ncbi:MAG: RNA polymerase sigma factor [Minisyncoccales bacterium]